MSLPLLLLSSNWIMLLFSLELNLLVFLWILKKNFMLYKISFFMKYFLYQSINSLGIVMSILLSTQENLTLLIFIFLFSKMGLPPFFLWLFSLMKLVSNQILLFLMTFQKIPLLIVCQTFLKLNFSLFLVLLLGFSSLGLWNQLAFSPFFYFSSMNNSCMILLAAQTSKTLFFVYLSIYLLSMAFFLKSFFNKTFHVKTMSMKSSSLLVFFFFLLGLPPSPLFFIKLMLFMKLLLFLPIWQLLLVVLSTVIPMFMYMDMMTQMNFFKPNTPLSKPFHWTLSWIVTLLIISI